MNKICTLATYVVAIALFCIGCDSVRITKIPKQGKQVSLIQQPAEKTEIVKETVKEADIPLIIPPEIRVYKEEYHNNTMIGSNGNGNNGNGSGIVEGSGKTKLRLEITADYPPEVEITPDNVMLGGVSVRDGDEVQTGRRDLLIEKAGYEKIEQKVTVNEGPSYTIRRELTAKPRAVKFNFTDARSGEKIDADEVLISNRNIQEGKKLPVGKKTLEVTKKGYELVIDSFVLEPGEEPYVITKQLNPMAVATKATLLKWIVETEFPPGEEVEPETVLVDSDSVENGSAITAGEHTITIKHPAHETLVKSITVPAGAPEYEFKATLITLPRIVNLNIRHDVDPTAELGGIKVQLKSITSGKARDLSSGDKVKPGAYELHIEQRGYEPIKVMKKINPIATPFEINEMLESKPVQINANISYDVDAPGDLPPGLISFTSGEGVSQQISPGGRIKPGSYNYAVVRTGYQMAGGRKNLDIKPSESAYSITESMIAQQRQVAFDIVDSSRGEVVMVTPLETTLDGRRTSFGDLYTPGKTYHIAMKFSQYQPVELDFKVEPGSADAPFVVKVPVKRK